MANGMHPGNNAEMENTPLARPSRFQLSTTPNPQPLNSSLKVTRAPVQARMTTQLLSLEFHVLQFDLNALKDLGIGFWLHLSRGEPVAFVVRAFGAGGFVGRHR
jgi:hypothetical protein